MEVAIEILSVEWPWLFALAFAALAGARIGGQQGRPFRKHSRKWGRFPRSSGEMRRSASDASAAPDDIFDPAAQLREVERATFKARRLLNASETRLFTLVERTLADVSPSWRVMAQVSLGEILASPNEAAYRAINSKRVDLLVICAEGNPLHAIEFQGSGHNLGPAATRDAVKREALRKAGIGYIEIVPGDTPADVRRIITRAAGTSAAA